MALPYPASSQPVHLAVTMPSSPATVAYSRPSPSAWPSGLTDAQKRALRLADNKIALGAGWDLDLLNGELAELSALNFDLDLTLTGFSSGELNVLLSGTTRLTVAAPPARAV